ECRIYVRPAALFMVLSRGGLIVHLPLLRVQEIGRAPFDVERHGLAEEEQDLSVPQDQIAPRWVIAEGERQQSLLPRQRKRSAAPRKSGMQLQPLGYAGFLT